MVGISAVAVLTEHDFDTFVLADEQWIKQASIPTYFSYLKVLQCLAPKTGVVLRKLEDTKHHKQDVDTLGSTTTTTSLEWNRSPDITLVGKSQM